MDIRVTKSRVLPHAGRKLQAFAQHAPRLENFAAGVTVRLADRLRPFLTLLYALRRRVATGGVGLLTVWLFVHVMFGANGMVVYKQKKAEYQTLQKEIEVLQSDNTRYTSQIKSLQTDPKTIEKEAREQLHYARPEEVIYVAPQPAVPDRPTNNAARK